MFYGVIAIRPYYIIQGRDDVGVVVLPSFWFRRYIIVARNSVSCRGEYTGEETEFITLVLPSLNRVDVSFFLLFVFFFR